MFKKILIVGGNGSIGQSITNDLVKEKGYTLEGAKDQLKVLNKNFEIIKKLEKIKANLINIKKEL